MRMRRESSEAGKKTINTLRLKMYASEISIRNNRIPHSKILKLLQTSSGFPNDIVEIYQNRVLPCKTRTIRLLGKKQPAKVLHTLLGYEVQACYKRIHCPDAVTANYLKLFTELGCHSIHLPYDPTLTARVLPDLEACLARISKGICSLFPGDQDLQNYVTRKVFAIIRKQLKSSSRASETADKAQE